MGLVDHQLVRGNVSINSASDATAQIDNTKVDRIHRTCREFSKVAVIEAHLICFKREGLHHPLFLSVSPLIWCLIDKDIHH